jgi:hypothetical protein
MALHLIRYFSNTSTYQQLGHLHQAVVAQFSSLLAYFAITQSGNRSVIEGVVLLTNIYRHWYYSKAVITALKPDTIYVKFHQSIMIIV